MMQKLRIKITTEEYDKVREKTIDVNHLGDTDLYYGITKVHIGKDFIRMYEPEEWHEVEEITHNYCYGCSTPQDSQLTQSRED